MISVQINGAPFTHFIRVAVTVSLETLANDFSITASSVDGFPPLRRGDSIVLAIDGSPVLTGFIDEVAGNDREGEHAAVYTGRDKTGDLLDSQINVINDIRAAGDLTLAKIIEKVVSHIGAKITVKDELKPKPFNSAEDIIAPKVGQGAFEFIAKYASKRQALLSSTGDGEILITQSSPKDSGAVVQRLQGSDSNNILAQDWSINGSKVFSKYIQRGQLNPLALNLSGSSSTGTVEDQGATETDGDVRAGRQRVRVESASYSSDQLKDRVKWEKQLAKARASRFSCTVKGHEMPSGGAWSVNTLVQVNSDTASISQKMLLVSTTFSQGEGQPTITSLNFAQQNVYTINESLLAQRPTGGLIDAFKPLG